MCNVPSTPYFGHRRHWLVEVTLRHHSSGGTLWLWVQVGNETVRKCIAFVQLHELTLMLVLLLCFVQVAVYVLLLLLLLLCCWWWLKMFLLLLV